MRTDDIKTKELFLPPWKFCGVSLFGGRWHVQVFHQGKCVNALHDDEWETGLERAKAWAIHASLQGEMGDNK